MWKMHNDISHGFCLLPHCDKRRTSGGIRSSRPISFQHPLPKKKKKKKKKKNASQRKKKPTDIILLVPFVPI